MIDDQGIKELLETLLGKIVHLEEKLKKTLLMMAEAIAEIRDVVKKNDQN